ncbi:MAG TPA: hypothetical protein VMO78_05745 [Rhizomicrobium sp.]|nr:hypothetical protein [Rhizomicrobium sp.]
MAVGITSANILAKACEPNWILPLTLGLGPLTPFYAQTAKVKIKDAKVRKRMLDSVKTLAAEQEQN